MLEIQNLKKSFGHKHAVRGVSFTLTPGSVVGFLGPNGAGKTTTLRMIAGVLEPDSGDVMIDGHSITSDRHIAQKSLGYLPEGAPLYDEMTPPQFLNFIATAHGLGRVIKKDAVERAIADARIGNVSQQRIGSLSKGYRRRVGLAAAILHDPPVLVLDEPTDGLDPNQKRAVRSLVARIAPKKAIVISTHTLTEVPAMCSRALVIDQGMIVADETPKSLAERAEDGQLETAFTQLTARHESNPQ